MHISRVHAHFCGKTVFRRHPENSWTWSKCSTSPVHVTWQKGHSRWIELCGMRVLSPTSQVQVGARLGSLFAFLPRSLPLLPLHAKDWEIFLLWPPSQLHCVNNGAGDVPLYAMRARDVCGEEPVLRSNECSVQLSLVLKRGVILPAACLESTRNQSASLPSLPEWSISNHDRFDQAGFMTAKCKKTNEKKYLARMKRLNLISPAP